MKNLKSLLFQPGGLEGVMRTAFFLAADAQVPGNAGITTIDSLVP